MPRSWHHSYVKAIAPHFFVLSNAGNQLLICFPAAKIGPAHRASPSSEANKLLLHTSTATTHFARAIDIREIDEVACIERVFKLTAIVHQIGERLIT